jgi:hypothetical protein
MTPKVASLSLLTLVAFGLTPTVSAPKPSPPDERAAALELFRSDDRLRTRLTLAHKERPLSEVLDFLEK